MCTVLFYMPYFRHFFSRSVDRSVHCHCLGLLHVSHSHVLCVKFPTSFLVSCRGNQIMTPPCVQCYFTCLISDTSSADPLTGVYIVIVWACYMFPIAMFLCVKFPTSFLVSCRGNQIMTPPCVQCYFTCPISDTSSADPLTGVYIGVGAVAALVLGVLFFILCYKLRKQKIKIANFKWYV